MDRIEFIARARYLGWKCFQLGASLPIPQDEEVVNMQINSLKKGVLFALENPNATAEDNHIHWMNARLADGWVYGEVLDWQKKTHPSIVPFKELPQVEKDKDIMDLMMTREFSKLWDSIHNERKGED